MGKRRKVKKQTPPPMAAGALTHNGKIPKTPEELAEFWYVLSGEHFESYTKARRLCEEVIDHAVTQFERNKEKLLTDAWPEGGEIVASDGIVYTRPEVPIQLYEPKQVRAIVSALKLCIEGERQAVKMQYDDRAVAIQTVQQLGFILTLDDGTIDIDTSVVEVENAPSS